MLALLASRPLSVNLGQAGRHDDGEGAWLQIPEDAVNRVGTRGVSSSVVVAILVVIAPLLAAAQPGSKVHRIGFLGNSTPALEANLVSPFREGLRELGYVEGQNIVIEYRWAEGKYERLPVLVTELLARNVDLIVTAATPASHAVKKATTSVPLVMVAVGDPVGSGLVPNLVRPGGNITGLTSMGDELEGKRLELLDARSADQLDKTLDVVSQKRPEALLVPGDRVFLTNRMRIVQFAAQQRLPTICAYRELVEPFSFGDAGALRAVVGGAGFRDVRLRAEVKMVRFRSAEHLVRAVVGGAPTMMGALTGQGEGVLDGIIAEVTETTRHYVDDEGWATPAVSHIVTAIA